MDIVDAATRSRMMSRIRGADTKPELLIRSGLHRRGYRFRKHVRNLPGTPDLLLPRYRAAVLVHGCFWHLHGCRLTKVPATRTDFWLEKLQRNCRRDEQQVAELAKRGLRCLVVWECSLRPAKPDRVERVLDLVETWLRSGDGNFEIGEAQVS